MTDRRQGVELDRLAALADPRRHARGAEGSAGVAHATAPEVDVGPEDDAGRQVAVLHAMAAQGLAASTWADEDAQRDAVAQAVRALARDGNAAALTRAIEAAPSLAVARYLWRALEAADTDPQAASRHSEATLATTLFALPVVFVAAAEAPASEAHAAEVHASEAPPTRVVPGFVREPEQLAAMLREYGAFGPCETFALAGTLAGADAIGLARLPALLVASRPDVPGAPLVLDGSGERVFLRFLVGALLAAPGVDPLRSEGTGTWGAPLARALQGALAVSGVSLLALPFPPRRLVAALRCGRAAQREVAAQLFASNAIRKFRARVGEPTAILSAHRAADAPGGGELRLSLSSPFEPREAEGLRVSVYPYEAIDDVAAMLVDLLDDCRVAAIRIEPGVHPDLDPATGSRLLFKDVGAPVTRAPAH